MEEIELVMFGSTAKFVTRRFVAINKKTVTIGIAARMSRRFLLRLLFLAISTTAMLKITAISKADTNSWLKTTKRERSINMTAPFVVLVL